MSDPTEGHSPLPWTRCWNGGNAIYDADGSIVGVFENYFDAEALIESMDEAPKLRERVKVLEGHLQELLEWCRCDCIDPGQDTVPCRVCRAEALLKEAPDA